MIVGVTSLSCLLMSQYHPVERKMMQSLSHVYRDCSHKELNLALPEGKFKFGKYIKTMQIDMEIYLKYLMEEFTGHGGVLTQGKVTDLSELRGECDVAVNCTGLGARFLCSDSSVIPLRGQVSWSVRVEMTIIICRC